MVDVKFTEEGTYIVTCPCGIKHKVTVEMLS